MTKRTTFFSVERHGVTINGFAAEASSDRARALALYERVCPDYYGHRSGHWSKGALDRLAARIGGTVKSAYSVCHDSKGFYGRREIV